MPSEQEHGESGLTFTKPGKLIDLSAQIAAVHAEVIKLRDEMHKLFDALGIRLEQ